MGDGDVSPAVGPVLLQPGGSGIKRKTPRSPRTPRIPSQYNKSPRGDHYDPNANTFNESSHANADVAAATISSGKMAGAAAKGGDDEEEVVLYDGAEASLKPYCGGLFGRRWVRVSNFSIEITDGAISRELNRVDLRLVYNIAFHQSGTDRFCCCGWGTIVLRSTDSTSPILRLRLKNAGRVFAELSDIIHRRQFPNEDAVEIYRGGAKQACNCYDTYVINSQYATLSRTWWSRSVDHVQMSHVYDIAVTRSCLDRCLGRGALTLYVANIDRWKESLSKKKRGTVPIGGSSHPTIAKDGKGKDKDGANQDKSSAAGSTTDSQASLAQPSPKGKKKSPRVGAEDFPDVEKEMRDVAVFYLPDPDKVYREILPSINQQRAMRQAYNAAYANNFSNFNALHDADEPSPTGTFASTAVRR